MRIGVAGTHGTGKTSLVEDLCEHLPGHTTVNEPYIFLEEQDYVFAYPPSPDDYVVQLRKSLHLLGSSARNIIFDRTPLDFVAYLVALGIDAESIAETAALRPALASLDLLVVVPITTHTERALPRPDLPNLREAMNDALLDLVYRDSLEICQGIHSVELDCALDQRTKEVSKALARVHGL